MADEEMIRGGREIGQFLQGLPVKVERNILRAALRAGINEFKAEIKQNVPVDSGALRSSVQVSVKSKRGTVYARVKVGGKKAPHAHLVEFGTAAHKIKAKKHHALAFGGLTVQEVDHPGAKSHPFVRPAFDSKSQAAIAATGNKIRERLTKEGINVPTPESD